MWPLSHLGSGQLDLRLLTDRVDGLPVEQETLTETRI